MKRLEQYIALNIDRAISLGDMAATVGLSKMDFAAQFRALTGFRPREYLLFKRIERAKAVMTETGMPPCRGGVRRRLQCAGPFFNGVQALHRENAGAMAAGVPPRNLGEASAWRPGSARWAAMRSRHKPCTFERPIHLRKKRSNR